MIQTERAFLRQVAAQTPEELKETVLNADAQQERVLRIYLGAGQFDAILRMAAQQSVRGAAAKKGNVVVLHGLAGGELTLVNSDLRLLTVAATEASTQTPDERSVTRVLALQLAVA